MKKRLTLTLIASLLAGGLTAQINAIGSSEMKEISPIVPIPLPNFEAKMNAMAATHPLSQNFSIPDNPEAVLNYEIINVANPAIANISIDGDELRINFLAPGQTYAVVQASAGTLAVTDTFAVGVYPTIEGNYEIVTFDDLPLEQESFWNGSDGSAGFASGPLYFRNFYDPDWFFWSGWSYSNTTDNTTPGFMNSYSAYPSARLDSLNGKNYGVSYIYGNSVIEMKDSANHAIKGLFVTNSTYTALSMKSGDDYSKRFGGFNGSDPDWLELSIKGLNTEGDSSVVKYKLADYTAEADINDYIIETWQWIDLTSLGEVNRLEFSLRSTDNGDYGMNTPAYFCIDNLYVKTATASAYSKEQPKFSLYPNPSTGHFTIAGTTGETASVTMYDIRGSLIWHAPDYSPGDQINPGDLKSGIYLVRIESEDGVAVERLVVE